MKNIIDEIKSYAKKKQHVRVYFDMDGVLAPYDITDKGPIEIREGYYIKKKPLSPSIDIAKYISEISNVDVYILSSCCYPNQIDEKKRWIKKYAPFFKQENIKVICWEEYDLEKVNKYSLKAEVLEGVFEKTKDIIFYVDDNPYFLEHAKKSGNIHVFHNSAIIECLTFCP